jgi:hypothetical protein
MAIILGHEGNRLLEAFFQIRRAYFGHLHDPAWMSDMRFTMAGSFPWGTR